MAGNRRLDDARHYHSSGSARERMPGLDPCDQLHRIHEADLG